MKRFFRRAGIGTACVLAAVQLIPVERTNPPVTRDLGAPPAVDAMLRRSCYDCHSNETRWPWYARVAPVSWLVSRDVVEGRREVNFSTWDRYNDSRRADILEESVFQIEEGEMPMPVYLLTHRDARISPDELRILREWAGSGEEDDDDE